VVYLAGELVYKVCSTATAEPAMMRKLVNCRPHVCPAVIADDAVSFAMKRGVDLHGVTDLDLFKLTTDLFWAVFQLHEQNVAHCDIKPCWMACFV
jgi:hypothetical protein